MNHQPKEKKMNPQSNQTNRQKIREAIFNDVNSVWQIVESLEKKSIKSFGEHDPMTKTLGFACVHMMNTSFEIEERVSESINKLKPESVDQLLEILVRVHGIFPFESNPGKVGSRIAKIGSNTFYEERERRFCM